MPRNASGVFTLVAGNPVVSGTIIDSVWANGTLADVATEMTDSLSRSGKGGATAPIKFANGSATTPGVAFTNDVNSGMYLAGAGDVRISASSQNIARFNGGNLYVWDATGVAWVQVYSTKFAPPRIQLGTSKVEIPAADGDIVFTLAGTEFGRLVAASQYFQLAKGVVGDPGSEATGINIGGVTYEAVHKVSDINSANVAQAIYHRHSPTLPASIIGARAISADATHGPVVNNTGLFVLYGAGWTGAEYNLFGSAGFYADSSGTIDDASSPGAFVIALTPDGGTAPVNVLAAHNTGDATLTGQLTSVNRRSEVTGAAYATVTNDADKMLTSVDATPQTITITDGAHPVGAVINFKQEGDGLLTVALSSGTLTPPPNGETYMAGKGAIGGAYKDAAGSWTLFGGFALTPANVYTYVPVGMIAPFPANTVSPGWLALNGQAVNRADEPDLWAYAQVSGNLVAQGSKEAGNFGDGNGTTTFTLPDYRAEFVRGWDNGRGVDSGRLIGSWQDHQFEDHIHEVYPMRAGPDVNDWGNGQVGTNSTLDTSLPTSGNHGSETRPRNVAALWCIKA